MKRHYKPYSTPYDSHIKAGQFYWHVPTGHLLEVTGVRRKYILFGPKVVSFYRYLRGSAVSSDSLLVEDFLKLDLLPRFA